MATENRKLKVFLCHSKGDKLKVRRLYRRLVADGFDAWFDEEKIMAGQDWDLAIQKAVRESDMVIVCLSRDSVSKSGYVQKEIRFALDIADEQPEGRDFLIPAKFEECSLPYRLKRFQAVNLFERSGYQKLTEPLYLKMDFLKIRFDSREVLPKTREDKISLPLLGPIDSGVPLPELEVGASRLVMNTDTNGIEISKALLPDGEIGNDLYALEVKGDGLNDAMINDGDIVIMKPATKAINGEMVALWFPRSNEATLKYFFDEKNRYRLQSANPSMKPIFVKKDEPMEVKGKVIMVIRRSKVDKLKI